MILRWLAVAALAAVASPGLAQELPARVFADIPEDEVQDLLFFGQGRPLLVRLRVRVDGGGFRTRYHDLAVRLHRRADLDRDGRLGPKEARDLMTRLVKLARVNGLIRRDNGYVNVATPAADVGVDDLAHMIQLTFGEFRIDTAAPVESMVEERAFALLDRDRDGRLSGPELAEAARSLVPLDLDDDEVITAEELGPYVNPNANPALVRAAAAQPIRATPPSLVVADAYSWGTVRQILEHYRARKQDETLDAGRLRIGPTAFARLDRDGDGSIDAVDLERAIRDSPDVEILIRLGRREPDEPRIERVDRPGPAPFGAPMIRNPGEDALVLELEAEEIEFRVDPRMELALSSDRANFRAQFRTADLNNNGALETREASRFTSFYELSLVTDLADGKLSEAEFEAILDRRDELNRLRMVLGTAERGRSLLDILDLNKDRKLTPRELRTASKTLGADDRDRDGRIARGEPIRQHRWTFGRGEPPRVATQMAPAQPQPPVVSMYRPAPTLPDGTPDWFRKMDRNRDGDLTPREFLGTRSAFDAYDLDRDGLIAPSEASRRP